MADRAHHKKTVFIIILLMNYCLKLQGLPPMDNTSQWLQNVTKPCGMPDTLRKWPATSNENSQNVSTKQFYDTEEANMQPNYFQRCEKSNLTEISPAYTESVAENATLFTKDRLNVGEVGHEIDVLEGKIEAVEHEANASRLTSDSLRLDVNASSYENSALGHEKVAVGEKDSQVSEAEIFNDLDDEQFIATCEGKCGLERSFPCGCSAVCVVYGTCCQNMSIDCPHVVQEATSKFSHLLNVEIVCGEELVFKIASCPADDVIGDFNTRERQDLNYTESSVFGNVGSSSDLSQPRSGLEELSTGLALDPPFSFNSFEETFSDSRRVVNEAILLSAPITDAATGFTFVNRSIYDCNKHISSKVHLWTLQLEYTRESPQRLEDLKNLVKGWKRFIATFDARVLTSHLCRFDLIRTCSNTTDVENDLDKKCQDQFAVVQARPGEPPKFYANIFCAYCNEGRHKSYAFAALNQIPSRDLKLSALLFLTAKGDYKVKLLNPASITVSWVLSKCVSPELAPGQREGARMYDGQLNPSNCKTTCSVVFKLSPDNRCKAEHMTYFAVADELPMLCPTALTHFGSFIVCALKQLLPSLQYADFFPPTVQVKFDRGIKKMLYTATIKMNLTFIADSFYSNKNVESMQNLHRLMNLAQAWRRYRMTHDLCTKNDGHIEEALKWHSTLPAIVQKMTNAAEEIRGPVMSADNTTIMCTSFTTRESTTPGTYPVEKKIPLICFEDGVREFDREIVQALSRSKCFDYKPEATNNLGVSFSLSQWTLLCWALVLSSAFSA